MEISERTPGLQCQGKLGSFLDAYFVAEALAKKIQQFYQNDKNRPDSDKVETKQLAAAHRHFSIPMNEDDIRSTFAGGPGTRGSKSARQLRNGYVHSLSPNDREEIEKNFHVIHALLVQYTNSITGACQTQK